MNAEKQQAQVRNGGNAGMGSWRPEDGDGGAGQACLLGALLGGTLGVAPDLTEPDGFEDDAHAQDADDFDGGEAELAEVLESDPEYLRRRADGDEAGMLRRAREVAENLDMER